jgi:hypothetical protein
MFGCPDSRATVTCSRLIQKDFEKATNHSLVSILLQVT